MKFFFSLPYILLPTIPSLNVLIISHCLTTFLLLLPPFLLPSLLLPHPPFPYLSTPHEPKVTLGVYNYHRLACDAQSALQLLRLKEGEDTSESARPEETKRQCTERKDIWKGKVSKERYNEIEEIH